MTRTTSDYFFIEGKILKHIEIENLGRRIESNLRKTLLEVFNQNRVKISQSCGGMGTCGTCRIVVHEGLEKLVQKNEIEEEVSESRGWEKNERLACQCQAVGGLKIVIP